MKPIRFDNCLILTVGKHAFWSTIGSWMPFVVRVDQQRATVVSVGYNIGLMTFGGSAPAMSEWLFIEYGSNGPTAWLYFVNVITGKVLV